MKLVYWAAFFTIALNVYVLVAVAVWRRTEGFVQPTKQDTPDEIPYNVTTLPDILTSEECDALVDHAANSGNMAASKVWSGDAAKPDFDSQHRTSTQLWIEYDDTEIGRIARKLRSKAAQLTGVFDPSAFEKVQLAKYGTNAEYKQHFDSCTSQCPNNRLCRIATLLVYLNEPQAGGATVFPNMDISVSPQKGSASFFYNVDVRDSSFPELNSSLHAGAPVTQGEKYIANVWVKCPGN